MYRPHCRYGQGEKEHRPRSSKRRTLPPGRPPPATVDAACTPPPTTEDAAAATRTVPIIVASAHDRKPSAVSRKKTSWVCRPVHLVRSRPETKPPRCRGQPLDHNKPDPSADCKRGCRGTRVGPPKSWSGRGPHPSDVRTTPMAIAATAPAITAAQLTADAGGTHC